MSSRTTSEIAQEDLDGAKALAKTNNRNAGYLCEQVAEKVLRAVLTSEGKHAGIGHHLDDMVSMLPDGNPLKPMLRRVEELAAFATTYRYPSPAGRMKPPPTPTKLAQYLFDVEACLLEASKRFGVDLAEPNTPARRCDPIR